MITNTAPAMVSIPADALAALVALAHRAPAAPCPCQGGPRRSVIDTVRAELRRNADITDTALADVVRAVHGDWDALADTVSRSRRRVEKETEES